MAFPIPFVPGLSYRTGGRKFGAPRQEGRKHAGCDLIAPLGTPVIAVADGVVMEAAEREFYRGTYALVVQHSGYVARYCEVRGAAPGIIRGLSVKAGTVIGYVGKMYKDSMLHFELYEGSYGRGHLTDRSNKPFQRRADLKDPSVFLDKIARELYCG
jgi:murein DD-endopeptidase MepM/ murein hydrolase activator NlpD